MSRSLRVPGAGGHVWPRVLRAHAHHAGHRVPALAAHGRQPRPGPSHGAAWKQQNNFTWTFKMVKVWFRNSRRWQQKPFSDWFYGNCEVCGEVPQSFSTALQTSVWRLQRMGGKCPPALCNHRHLLGLDECFQLGLDPPKNTNLQLVLLSLSMAARCRSRSGYSMVQRRIRLS